jgi:hypothetical protein
MTGPVSIRLDDQVRAALTEEADARGIGLSSYIRQLVEAEARRLRRARIRAASEVVGKHIAESAESRAFFKDWGTPSTFGQLGD